MTHYAIHPHVPYMKGYLPAGIDGRGSTVAAESRAPNQAASSVGGSSTAGKHPANGSS